MNHQDFIDPEMRELLDVLGRAIVPLHKRKPVLRTNLHVPYYSRGRYDRL